MSDSERCMWVAGTIVACAALFAATWLLSTVVPPVRRRFLNYDFKQRCDWCSRTVSVVHANVVLFFLWRETVYNVQWDEWFQTTSDLSTLERIGCISAGFFLLDLVIVVVSRMNKWLVAVFHHVTVLWPLTMVLFGGCENYAFFASGYFFVEMTILPVQLVQWCSALDMRASWVAALGYHLTFWLWIPFRLVVPVFMTWNGIGVVMPADDIVGLWQCKVPIGHCGIAIWGFCWHTFVTIIAPGYFKWVSKGGMKTKGSKPLTPNTIAAMESCGSGSRARVTMMTSDAMTSFRTN